MSHENKDELTPAEREIEAAMKSLRPSDSGLDPIAVAFAAGAAGRGQSLWMWRAAAAVFAIALGVSLIARDGSRPAGTPPGTVIVQHPMPAGPVTTYITMEARNVPSPWRLRERVLDQGLEALDVPTYTPARDEPVLRAGDTNWRSS